jgi:predicted  nucleic acid-binding Zn-ribbon protein
MTAPLLALQDLDVAIEELRRRVGVLPERAAAHELNERRHKAEATIAELAAQLDKLAAEEAEIESSLDPIEKRAASLDATLRTPGSATRDAQAIIHEIDQLKEKAAELEEAGLELLEQRDSVLAQQADQRAILESVAAEVPTVLAALTAAEGETGKELAALQGQRGDVAALVEPDALATYERLRERLGGVAVARVHSGACTGCHLALPSQELDRFNHLSAGEHATCEQCGRMLIRE